MERQQKSSLWWCCGDDNYFAHHDAAVVVVAVFGRPLLPPDIVRIPAVVKAAPVVADPFRCGVGGVREVTAIEEDTVGMVVVVDVDVDVFEAVGAGEGIVVGKAYSSVEPEDTTKEESLQTKASESMNQTLFDILDRQAKTYTQDSSIA